jgi:hypothetical protein
MSDRSTIDQEVAMKSPTLPLSNDPKELKSNRKKLAARDKRLHAKQRPEKRLKIVQSMNAGHVRGGHSFH